MKESYSLLCLRVIGWKETAQEESRDLSDYVVSNIGVYTLEDKVRTLTDEEFAILTSHFPDIGEPEDFAVIEIQVVTWEEDATQEAQELKAFAGEAVGIMVLDAEITPLSDDEWEACLACEPETFS